MFTCLTPSHYLSQAWFIVNCFPGNGILWNFVQNTDFSSKKRIGKCCLLSCVYQLRPIAIKVVDRELCRLCYVFTVRDTHKFPVDERIRIACAHMQRERIMMTSSNGNIFCYTGPLCGEFTGHRWIPQYTGQWRGALMFSLICAWISGWANNREAGDLRRHCAHYDVIVIKGELMRARYYTSFFLASSSLFTL